MIRKSGNRRAGRVINRAIATLLAALLLAPAMLLGTASIARAQTVVQIIDVGYLPFCICVNPSTNKVYVANEADSTVSVIDGATDTVKKTIALASATWDIKANPVTNKVYVTGQDVVTVIDGSTDSVSKTVAVGEYPHSIGVNPVTDKIYVSNYFGNTVSVIDGSTDSVIKTITVGSRPGGIGVNTSTNQIYVPSGDDGAISEIDGATDNVSKVITIPGVRPGGLLVNPTTNRIYALGGGVSILDMTTETCINTIYTMTAMKDMAINPITSELYVTSTMGSSSGMSSGILQRINSATGGVTSEVSVQQVNPEGVCVNPDTNKVYVVNKDGVGLYDPPGSVSVIYDPPNPSFYFAEGTCRPGFDPYICIQNPGDTQAEVTITYMLGDGNTQVQTLAVPAHSRSTTHPADVLGVGDDAAHDFSAKVECTNGQQIIAERPMYFNYHGWTGGHNVIGATGSTSSFFFAEGTCRPGFDPYICIQAPGYSAEVSITYRLGDGTSRKPDSFTVPGDSRFTIHPADVLGVGDDAAHDFSAEVTCRNGDVVTGWVVIERPMYFDYRGWTGGSDVVGAANSATSFYFAEGTTRPGFDPYICIENPREEQPYSTNPPARVKITYMKGDGTTASQDISVPVSSRATVHPADVLGVGDDAAHDFSCKVECTNEQAIVAERPMYFNYQGKWTGGSDVVGTTAPSSTFYFAEGTCRPNFDTYFCVQNPGSTDAAVRITYMLGDGATKEQDITVGANSRHTVNCRDILGTGEDAAHDFSAKVECTNGGDIVVERPMYFNYKGWTGGHDVVGYQR